MIKLFLNLFLALVFWGVFIWVIFSVEPPKTFAQINLEQLLSFYIPLLLALSFTINLLLKSILASGSLALGIIFLISLKAMGLFNWLYITLTIIATLLLVSYFKKDLSSLTSLSFVRKMKRSRRNL